MLGRSLRSSSAVLPRATTMSKPSWAIFSASLYLEMGSSERKTISGYWRLYSRMCLFSMAPLGRRKRVRLLRASGGWLSMAFPSCALAAACLPSLCGAWGGAVTALSGTACRQETGRVRRGAPQRDGPTGGQRERSAAGRRGSPPPQVRRGDRGGGPFPHNANYPGAFHAMGKL